MMFRIGIVAGLIAAMSVAAFGQYGYIEPLRPKLENQTNQFNESVPDSIRNLFEDGVADVVNSGIVESSLQVGQAAPDFTLPSAAGGSVQLSALLKNGPVALVWYRGGWCPYCNLQLQDLSLHAAEFTKLNAQLVAISPEVPDSSLTTKERHDLGFDVVSDTHNVVAKQYGIVYKIPAGVANIYDQHLGLHKYNDDASNELPLACVFVIDTDGIVKWRYVDGDYRNRAEPRDILTALRKLNRESAPESMEPAPTPEAPPEPPPAVPEGEGETQGN